MTVKPSQLDALHRLVTLTDLRHQAISNNLANVNTPGYKRWEVSFDEVAALFTSSPGAAAAEFDDSQCMRRDLQSPARTDGNNVDVDKELGELGKNDLLQQTLIHILGKKLAMMQSAITGR